MAASALSKDQQTSATPAKAAALATMCKAAGDPLRLEILRALRHDSFGVLELAGIFGMPQPGMSHHLKILTASGLCVPRRQGTTIFYRRALPSGENELSAFQASLYAAVDAIPLARSQDKAIEKIYAERAQSSRSYFEKNAAEFAEHQGQLCDLSQYILNLQELLDLAQLPKKSRVLEVGPGEGELLAVLAQRFDHVVALDNSGEMLARAQSKGKGKDKASKRIEYVEGSLEDFDPGKAPLDAAVLNMVLHHLSSPAQAFKKLRKIVRQGGRLLIADLGPHQQEWTRASCGDLWMGFDPEELSGWAEAAGFTEDHGLYLGLKNGFQIQLKLFR